MSYFNYFFPPNQDAVLRKLQHIAEQSDSVVPQTSCSFWAISEEAQKNKLREKFYSASAQLNAAVGASVPLRAIVTLYKLDENLFKNTGRATQIAQRQFSPRQVSSSLTVLVTKENLKELNAQQLKFYYETQVLKLGDPCEAIADPIQEILDELSKTDPIPPDQKQNIVDIIWIAKTALAEHSTRPEMKSLLSQFDIPQLKFYYKTVINPQMYRSNSDPILEILDKCLSTAVIPDQKQDLINSILRIKESLDLYSSRNYGKITSFYQRNLLEQLNIAQLKLYYKTVIVPPGVEESILSGDPVISVLDKFSLIPETYSQKSYIVDFILSIKEIAKDKDNYYKIYNTEELLDRLTISQLKSYYPKFSSALYEKRFEV